MPRIAELREIDGACWARVDMSLGSPIELLSPDEIEANRQREMKYLDEIDRLRAALEPLAAMPLWRDHYPDGPDMLGDSVLNGYVTPDQIRAARDARK